jgi:hypothetical protein
MQTPRSYAVQVPAAKSGDSCTPGGGDSSRETTRTYDSMQGGTGRARGRSYVAGVLGTAALGAYWALSAARVYTVVEGFGAPAAVWARAGAEVARAGEGGRGMQVVCVGKEWFRFPSSFFSPGALPPHTPTRHTPTPRYTGRPPTAQAHA